MEDKLLNGLNDLGYKGPLSKMDELKISLNDGIKNIEYTKLVSFLTNELRTLINIDEEVNSVTCPEDSVTFAMEVSSFLKELNCPYSSLVHGHISDRLQTINVRILLIDYLITELMGARILQEKKPIKQTELKLQETEEARNMRKILVTLRFSRPPANITIRTLFQKLTQTLQNALASKSIVQELVGQPLLNGFLSNNQWNILNGVQNDLFDEYKIRREMLLTRLDVTIQSFLWSCKTKGKDDLFGEIYSNKRKLLKTNPDVDLSDLLAARTDLAIIEKTSNSTVRKNTRSSLNKIIIGQVPDRGGRTSEQAPPPTEMPSWQQRSSTSFGGGNSGRSGRGGSSSSVQQNYSKSSYEGDTGCNNQGSSFDRAGSYNSNTNNYNKGNYENVNHQQKKKNYDNNYSRQQYDINCRSSYSNFDSAGSYANNYEHNSKRVKTYDNFQSERTTYTDQYAQDNERNQQYHQGRGNYNNRGGNSGFGRGRLNNNRGGGRNYY